MPDTHWQNDLLDRQKDAEFLIEFLKRRHAERKRAGVKGAYVLNVNAEWGFGKTYFLRGMAEDLREHHPVVMIDAWKNDFSDDPYTMVISEINAVISPLLNKGDAEKVTAAQATLKAVKQNAGKIILAGAKGAAKKLVTKVVGDGFEEISKLVYEKPTDEKEECAKPGEMGAVEEAATAGVKAFKDGVANVSDDLLDALATRMINDYQEVKGSQEQFRSSLTDLLNAFDDLNDLSLPLFVFIDELDRCRPPYAIGLLERIKHLFDVDDIVFVFATDTVQLTRAITGFYGSEFNSHNYLHRFFSRTYNLPKPESLNFIASMVAESGVNQQLWSEPSEGGGVKFLGLVSGCFNSGLREIERAMEILFDLTTTWPHKFPIELTIVYPYIISYLRSSDIDAWALKPLNPDIETLASRLRLGKPFYLRLNQTTYPAPTLHEYVSEFDRVRFVDFYDCVTEMHEKVGNAAAEDKALPRYIASVLDREYQATFSNVVERGYRSVIANYPNLIRYAGNLE